MAEETLASIFTSKPNPAAEAKAKRLAERAETKARHDALRANIGKVFTDGDRDAAVMAFVADKGIGSQRGEAFLVNFGNPNRSDFVFCADFFETFKAKG